MGKRTKRRNSKLSLKKLSRKRISRKRISRKRISRKRISKRKMIGGWKIATIRHANRKPDGTPEHKTRFFDLNNGSFKLLNDGTNIKTYTDEEYEQTTLKQIKINMGGLTIVNVADTGEFGAVGSQHIIDDMDDWVDLSGEFNDMEDWVDLGVPSSGVDELPEGAIKYADVTASTGDNVELLLFNADTVGMQSNPDPQIYVYQGSIMVDMRKQSDKKQMFVLPSQLNGAEYISINRIPNITLPWLQMYREDKTGGPRGQLAGDHNIAEFIVDKSYNDFRSGSETINYVREICDDPSLGNKISLKNGYLQISSDLTLEEIERLRDMMNTIQLLVSKDIPVSGYDINLKYKPYKDKKVHLAYASAIPIGNERGRPYGNPVSESVTTVANIIMEAQYIAALKAAKALKVEELFLMPLGGGVFNNKRSDIIKNLLNALKKVDVSGIDVKLLTYSNKETAEFKLLLS